MSRLGGCYWHVGVEARAASALPTTRGRPRHELLRRCPRAGLNRSRRHSSQLLEGTVVPNRGLADARSAALERRCSRGRMCGVWACLCSTGNTHGTPRFRAQAGAREPERAVHTRTATATHLLGQGDGAAGGGVLSCLLFTLKGFFTCSTCPWFGLLMGRGAASPRGAARAELLLWRWPLSPDIHGDRFSTCYKRHFQPLIPRCRSRPPGPCSPVPGSQYLLLDESGI